MNKTLRFGLIVMVLVGVIFAATSQAVWAGSQSAAPAANSGSNLQQKANLGTVIVPTAVSVPAEPEKEGINVIGNDPEGCPRSIRGQATLCGLEAGTDVFGGISEKPSGYLSKVVNLSFSAGSARLCFAAPQHDEKIFVKVGDGWTPLYTFYVDGQACVDVSASGQYVLGK
jgi:hypothetical protein